MILQKLFAPNEIILEKPQTDLEIPSQYFTM